MNYYTLLFVKAFLSFIISALICKSLIVLLNRKKLYVANKPELLVQKERKAKTPGFGGISFVVCSIIFTVIGSTEFDSYFYILIIAILGFGFEGFIDDIMKLKTSNGDGVTVKQKILTEFLLSSLIAFLIIETKGEKTNVLYFVFSVFYIFYFVNAVNITDGLDGLSTGTVLPVFILLLFLISQVFKLESQLFNFTLNLIFALFGFLIYNHKPAKIFMGDLGSQALGGAIATISLMLGKEIVILIAGMVLLLEFISSLIQIICIRFFNTKVFKIAPVHHLLEFYGVSETKIVSLWFVLSSFFSICAYLIVRFL